MIYKSRQKSHNDTLIDIVNRYCIEKLRFFGEIIITAE